MGKETQVLWRHVTIESTCDFTGHACYVIALEQGHNFSPVPFFIQVRVLIQYLFNTLYPYTKRPSDTI